MIQYQFPMETSAWFKDHFVRIDGFGRVVVDKCSSDQEHLTSSVSVYDPVSDTSRPKCRHPIEELFQDVNGKRGTLEVTVTFHETPTTIEEAGAQVAEMVPSPDAEVMSRFNGWWRELVTTDGKLDELKVARELFDYGFVMEQVSKVYSDITGGRMSKPNYFANVVISEATDFQNKVWEEALKDEKQRWAEDLIDMLVGTRFDETNLFDTIKRVTERE